MIVNPQNLRGIYVGFNTLFNRALTTVTPLYTEVATVTPSTTDAETYAWLGDIPGMREWIGDREVQNLSASDYTIKNKDFELTIGIDRNAIEDDKIGLFNPSIEMLGQSAAMHPDKLVFSLLKNGFNEKCFDGKAFFSSEHMIGKSKVSNKGTAKLSLDAYVAAGVYSDHECHDVKDAIAKLERGQFIMIREGTAARNLEALMPLLTGKYADRCMFCTDDKHPNDLLEKGHIDYIVKKAISLGADPITAVKVACHNAARYFLLNNRGGISPGYLADFVIIDNFQDFNIEQVYKKGVLMVDHGEIQDFPSPEIEPYLVERAHKTFHVAALTAEDFETMTTAFFPPTEHQLTELSGIKFWPSVCSFYGECNQTKIQMYNQAAAEEAGAEFYFGTTAEYIIMENGAVAGLVASDADGYVKITCKAVVCACGGMGGNPDMMAYFMPDMAQALVEGESLNSMSANDGRGVQMAYWAGAAVDKSETPTPMIFCFQWRSITRQVRAFQGLMVNADGKRYTNEDNVISHGALAFMGQKGHCAWAIWDDDYANEPQWQNHRYVDGPKVFEPPDEVRAYWQETIDGPGTINMNGSGDIEVKMVKADTIEELVNQLGLPADETLATIERYNGYCEKGVDEEFGKRKELLLPVKNGPFYGIRCTPWFLTTTGGIRCTDHMEVMDENNEIIEGLYCLGSMVGDMYSGIYTFTFAGQNLGSTCGALAWLLGKDLAAL